MKRYWKLIAISLLTMIVIGAFYIQKSMASNANIGFTFETESGSEEELRDVIFYADYNVSDLYNLVQITKDDTNSLSDSSFLERILNMTHDPNMKALVNEKRNYMRKKDLNERLFYESEKVLAFFDIEYVPIYRENVQYNYTFVVDMLDKANDERITFEVEYPEGNQFANMYVEDVQVMDNQLKAIVSAMPVTEPRKYYLYTFNLSEEKLIDQQLIMASEPAGEDYVYTTLVSPPNHFVKQNYALFIRSSGEGIAEDDYIGMAKSPSLEYYLFDIWTGELKKLAVYDKGEAIVSIENDTLYLLKVVENGISIRTYNIPNESFGESHEFPIADDGTALMEIYKGKLYSAYRAPEEDNVASIVVGDLKEGELLYEGKLRKPTTSKDSSFYINHIDFIY